jgi:hypothetical protein
MIIIKDKWKAAFLTIVAVQVLRKVYYFSKIMLAYGPSHTWSLVYRQMLKVYDVISNA